MTEADIGSRTRIGVNRAALRFRCDWWVFADWQTFIEYAGSLGVVPACFTTRDSLASLARRGLRPPAVVFEDIVADLPPCWRVFSASAALALAASLGTVDVAVFGADMAGALDYDGTTGGRNRRDADRWCREREIMASMVSAARRIGIEVTGLNGTFPKPN